MLLSSSPLPYRCSLTLCGYLSLQLLYLSPLGASQHSDVPRSWPDVHNGIMQYQMSVSLAPIEKSIHIPSSWHGHSICRDSCLRHQLWASWCLAHALTHVDATCTLPWENCRPLQIPWEGGRPSMVKGPVLYMLSIQSLCAMHLRDYQKLRPRDTHATRSSVILSVPQGEVQDRHATQIQSLQLQESNLLWALWDTAVGTGEARTQVWRWVQRHQCGSCARPQCCLRIMEGRRGSGMMTSVPIFMCPWRWVPPPWEMDFHYYPSTLPHLHLHIQGKCTTGQIQGLGSIA